MGKSAAKKPSASLLFSFDAVCLLIISKCPVSNQSGIQWTKQLLWPQHHSIWLQAPPESIPITWEPYPPTATPRCVDAAVQLPHVAKSWGCPGEPDEKAGARWQPCSNIPFAQMFARADLCGGRGTERGTNPEVWYRHASLQTPFSGSQMPIYCFQRSAVSACRIKWVN